MQGKMKEARMQGKESYLLEAPLGTIVAFRVSPKKDIYLSGEIIERNTEERSFKVKTRKGAIYDVDFSSVLWVKTGKRWPRKVFELLFGGM